MKTLLSYILAIIATFGLSPLTGKVIETNRATDTVTIALSNGHRYAFTGCEDYATGDYVSAILWSNGTTDPTDDEIVSVHYAGFCDYAEQDEPNDFPHISEFAEEFKRDFPGCEYELRTSREIQKDPSLPMSRADWDEYLVEVTTGTVLNDDLDGEADLPAPYNYISYRRVPFETKPGDHIVTYLVYEIHSDGEDDIIARYDYPLN